MIRAIFSVANNLAKRTRYSPTSIIEGREQRHLETLVVRQQQHEIEEVARVEAFKALQANTTCPFELERQQIVHEFEDANNSLDSGEAFRRLDDVDQRQAAQNWRDFKLFNKKA